MKSIILLMALSIWPFINCSSVSAQTDAFELESLKSRGALSPVQETIIRNKWELIVNEASTLSANEWVGTYSLTDGLTSGAQFSWSPTYGFLVWWNTCSHGWSDRINFGRVDFRDGVLRLETQLRAEGDKVYDVAPELVAVKWGSQHYLIPSNKMIAFSYAARNADRSYEIDEFFLKDGDREKRRSGLPSVPKNYRKYLVGKPIQARIVALKPESEIQRFKLNVGRRHGVVQGMKFFATSPTNIFMLVEVTEVSDTECEAYAITSAFKDRSNREVRPKVGWKLTSRAPRGTDEYYPG